MRIELIHPMIVHFPIVFGLSLLALDSLAMMKKWPLSGRGGVANASAALALAAGSFAVVVYYFGDQAFDIAMAAANAPKAALETHEELGTMTAFGLAGWAIVRSFLWWRTVKIENMAVYAIVAVEALFALAILITAKFGGDLVYTYGVAVQKLTSG